MDLREPEKSSIRGALKFLSRISLEQVKYEIVDNYGKLMVTVK